MVRVTQVILNHYKTQRSSNWVHNKGKVALIWKCELPLHTKINSMTELPSILDNFVANARNKTAVVIGGDCRFTNPSGEKVLETFGLANKFVSLYRSVSDRYQV